MKRLIILALVLTIALVMIGCPKPAENARNAIASAQGFIVAQQQIHGQSCKAAPSQEVCVNINKAVSAQNAAVTALETYCGWNPLAPPSDPNAPCVPVKGAEAALTAAVGNLNQIIGEIKGAAK